MTGAGFKAYVTYGADKGSTNGYYPLNETQWYTREQGQYNFYVFVEATITTQIFWIFYQEYEDWSFSWTNNSSSDDSSSNGGAIAGAVIGVVAFIVIIVALVWYFKYRPQKLRKEQEKQAIRMKEEEQRRRYQQDEPNTNLKDISEEDHATPAPIPKQGQVAPIAEREAVTARTGQVNIPYNFIMLQAQTAMMMFQPQSAMTMAPTHQPMYMAAQPPMQQQMIYIDPATGHQMLMAAGQNKFNHIQPAAPEEPGESTD